MANKQPRGRRPVGAIWLEDEGRYEYTQQYFDLREQAFIENRLKAKEASRVRTQILKNARPQLWKNNKPLKTEDTLDVYLKK